MPDKDWEHYMTKRPLPTYAEKLKEIEKKVNEWKRHKHHRQHGLKMRDVAEQLGISTVNLSNYVNTVEGMNFSAWLNSLRVKDAKSSPLVITKWFFILLLKRCNYIFKEIFFKQIC